MHKEKEEILSNNKCLITHSQLEEPSVCPKWSDCRSFRRFPEVAQLKLRRREWGEGALDNLLWICMDGMNARYCARRLADSPANHFVYWALPAFHFLKYLRDTDVHPLAPIKMPLTLPLDKINQMKTKYGLSVAWLECEFLAPYLDSPPRARLCESKKESKVHEFEFKW